jgi:hypothetical protein
MTLRAPAVVALLLASIPGARAAAVSAIQTDNGPVFSWFAPTDTFALSGQSAAVGWSFQVLGSDLDVASVGVFDDQNGLQDAHEVGIWDSSQTLLVDVTAPAGTSGTLIDGYRYIDISPITLTAGDTYFIAAFYPAKFSTTAPQDHVLANSSQTYDGVEFLNSVQTLQGTGIPFGFPNQNAAVNEGVFGPNFQFTTAVTATPEPSTVCAAGAAMLLLAGVLRRRA